LKAAPIVLVTFGLVAAACGSSSKTNAGSSTTAAAGASSTTAAGGASSTAAAGGGKTLIVSSDLPLQGASQAASTDTNNALQLLLDQAGGKAGSFSVKLQTYDDSTAAKGGWDDATCAKNAADHVSNTAEVAVMGTYNSGCAKIEVPVLNQDKTGPMLMVSHANTNPGLTKAWDSGEPDKYYPTAVRNYARIVATDDLQGSADAQFAAQVLKVKNCVVLNDAQTYGQGVAKAFTAEAKKQGINVVAEQAWDPKQPNYTALFEGFKSKNPDCVFLGGINDNNGEQLIRDKVSVLGTNDGAVKLIAPDGFTGYPSVQKMTESQGMYISFAGLPASELIKAGGAGAKFVNDFKAKFGHDPASAYSIYGAAALQIILAAIAKSDGTRKGVRDAAFGGITIPADQSVIGKAFGIDPTSGDVTARDMSIQILKNNDEQFLKAWPVS
jgi:branched-chain amino acid transport system substrate-binding protein